MGNFLVGLDLGQAADPSALAVVEVCRRFPAGAVHDPDVTPLVPHYNVRHLRRWPLGTAYTQIVEDVTALLERPPLPGSSSTPRGSAGPWSISSGRRACGPT